MEDTFYHRTEELEDALEHLLDCFDVSAPGLKPTIGVYDWDGVAKDCEVQPMVEQAVEEARRVLTEEPLEYECEDL